MCYASAPECKIKTSFKNQHKLLVKKCMFKPQNKHECNIAVKGIIVFKDV